MEEILCYRVLNWANLKLRFHLEYEPFYVCVCSPRSMDPQFSDQSQIVASFAKGYRPVKSILQNTALQPYNKGICQGLTSRAAQVRIEILKFHRLCGKSNKIPRSRSGNCIGDFAQTRSTDRKS